MIRILLQCLRWTLSMMSPASSLHKELLHVRKLNFAPVVAKELLQTLHENDVIARVESSQGGGTESVYMRTVSDVGFPSAMDESVQDEHLVLGLEDTTKNRGTSVHRSVAVFIQVVFKTDCPCSLSSDKRNSCHAMSGLILVTKTLLLINAENSLPMMHFRIPFLNFRFPMFPAHAHSKNCSSCAEKQNPRVHPCHPSSRLRTQLNIKFHLGDSKNPLCCLRI